MTESKELYHTMKGKESVRNEKITTVHDRCWTLEGGPVGHTAAAVVGDETPMPWMLMRLGPEAPIVERSS